jgi:predicted DNA-binding protein (MmcQ/YjbR family)
VAKKSTADRVKEYALSFPGAWEDHPWGETVAKVGKKVFVFLGHPDDTGGFGMSVKLPFSAADALSLPNAAPTGYGLGKAGWVSVSFDDDAAIPVEQVEAWIDESYRAVAGKKLIKELDGRKK